jgi:hypothetical protein
MKVLVDLNVVMDVLERRQPHYGPSLKVMLLARRNAIHAAVAAHTVANLAYFYERPKVIDFLRDRLLTDCEVCAADAALIRVGLTWGFKDIEDALQSAAALAWKASFVITRNTRDFKRSPVPALSPTDFLKRFFAATIN